MTKCCPENEKIKHRYALYLEAADGKQSSTADASLRAIARFEASTRYRPFKKFHIEHARQFRADLLEAVGLTGQPLSASTVTATLRRLREFFLWLSREPGYRSAINANDAAYFSPSGQDQRIASARRDRPVLEVDEIKHVVSLMPSTTAVERRDRALVAFALVSGMRDGALATLQLKHVDIEARTIFQGRPRGSAPRAARLSHRYFSRSPPNSLRCSLAMSCSFAPISISARMIRSFQRRASGSATIGVSRHSVYRGACGRMAPRSVGFFAMP